MNILTAMHLARAHKSRNQVGIYQSFDKQIANLTKVGKNGGLADPLGISSKLINDSIRVFRKGWSTGEHLSQNGFQRRMPARGELDADTHDDSDFSIKAIY